MWNISLLTASTRVLNMFNQRIHISTENSRYHVISQVLVMLIVIVVIVVVMAIMMCFSLFMGWEIIGKNHKVISQLVWLHLFASFYTELHRGTRMIFLKTANQFTWSPVKYLSKTSHWPAASGLATFPTPCRVSVECDSSTPDCWVCQAYFQQKDLAHILLSAQNLFFFCLVLHPAGS